MQCVSRHAVGEWEKGLHAMSHTPVGGHPPGWDIKLADRSSLPPVPGEERVRAPFPPPYLPEHTSTTFNRYHGAKGSEVLSGRRHGSQPSTGGAHVSHLPHSCCCEGPEGSSGGAGRSPTEMDKSTGKLSPPSFLRWARTLHDLLEDAEGVKLFQAYVRNAGILHSDRLDFYFACQGLKQQTEQTKVKQMVGAIYKFLRKSQLTTPEDVKRVVKVGLKEGAYMDPDVFDKMQQETERFINETTYPSFLRSDSYIQHIRSNQQAPSHTTLTTQSAVDSYSSGSSSSGSREQLCNSALPMTLATLHEGEELKLTQNMPPTSAMAPQRLTKGLLMVTQNKRLQPESFIGFGKKYSVYSYPHMAYSGYCPASRIDSELQSLSSGRTDSDAMSMSGSSVDGVSVCRGSSGWGSGGGNANSSTGGSRNRHIRNAMLESAPINRDPHIHDMVIPRILRIQKDQCRIMKPEEFAPLLIEKLEKVKRDLDSQEKLDRKLMENDLKDMAGQAIPPRMVAAALREKLQLDDDNDQDILDQHVSRVWSDLTPLTHSPGGQPSPPHLSHHPHHHIHHPHPHHYLGRHHRRRERDLQSTHSVDSGNVRDLDAANAPVNLDQQPQVSVAKSRSMPDYGDSFLRHPFTRRSLSKKTLTELTDSGVSVVSDVPPRPAGRTVPRPIPAVSSAPLSATPVDTRVLAWIQDHPAHSTTYTRRSYLGSRASSTERSGGSRDRPAGEAPAQPFAADPQMPPLPRPHTPTQLDEARRRLVAEQHAKHSKRSAWSKNTSVAASTAVDAPSTVVVFTFLDEQFPYRTKIPASPVTLKQFKEYLPKKGSYRYFFKTECEDLENKVIQEEIFNDSDQLPLWEGKIMARVKNME